MENHLGADLSSSGVRCTHLLGVMEMTRARRLQRNLSAGGALSFLVSSGVAWMEGAEAE